MNKTSLIFIVIGIIILGGLGYFYFNTETGIEQPNTENSIVEESITYLENFPFTPKTISAKEGQTVKLNVTSELADEVHLHGYDLSEEIERGGNVVFEFTADKTGRFEIELEEAEIILGTLEVYP